MPVGLGYESVAVFIHPQRQITFLVYPVALQPQDISGEMFPFLKLLTPSPTYPNCVTAAISVSPTVSYLLLCLLVSVIGFISSQLFASIMAAHRR
ncbi:MAG: hypothetical protein Ct9H300mP11_02940 [Chloroflexota bacterium]|nr:MAG: hypothetical protein Ct9H300mP11_02940 [Chloroflexota bacterium]